jgi:hypothetical protein
LNFVKWRWPAVGSLLLVSILVLVTLPGPRQLYWIKAQIVFLMPQNLAASGNPLYGQYQGLVSFAAVIEREFNGYNHSNTAAGMGATIYGMGVKNGYSVTLPNTGSQWESSFNRPYLDIEVVSDDPEQTSDMLRDVADEVLDLVSRTQRELGVSASNMIRAELGPPRAEVVLVSANQPRALLSLAVLAVLTFGLSFRARNTGTILRVKDRPRGSSRRRYADQNPNLTVNTAAEWRRTPDYQPR